MLLRYQLHNIALDMSRGLSEVGKVSLGVIAALNQSHFAIWLRPSAFQSILSSTFPRHLIKFISIQIDSLSRFQDMIRDWPRDSSFADSRRRGQLVRKVTFYQKLAWVVIVRLARVIVGIKRPSLLALHISAEITRVT